LRHAVAAATIDLLEPLSLVLLRSARETRDRKRRLFFVNRAGGKIHQERSITGEVWNMSVIIGEVCFG
jgi:hypothetical protein